jgi:hypothetical protein
VHIQFLVDDIVRQTTVLIAQLATAAGLRAPLARVADQVFVDLANELESQGVRRKVAADMFGLALRSYQTKLRRIADSQEVLVLCKQPRMARRRWQYGALVVHALSNHRLAR